MKLVSSAIFAAALVIGAAPVSAGDFDWSWVDQTTNTLVQGKLFGLVDGSQSLDNGQVNVTFSTYGNMIDTDASHYFGGGNVTVSGGQITFLSASWDDPTNGTHVWLGTDPCCSSFYPELSSSIGQNQYSCCEGNPMTFEARGAVPEPAAWTLMLAGFGAIGTAMRRRRRVAVSFA